VGFRGWLMIMRDGLCKCFFLELGMGMGEGERDFADFWGECRWREENSRGGDGVEIEHRESRE
jgi:hypothetical protein